MTKLMVWHIPQVPSSNPFQVKVNDREEAIKIIETLWDYDIYQFENNIKPDYSNASGLLVKNDINEPWEEYYNEEGEGINEIIEGRKK